MTHEEFIIGTVPATETEVEGQRVLEISTSKHHGVIVTTASVSIVRKTDRGYSMKTFIIFQEFNRRLQAIPAKPITQKKLQAAHDAIKDTFPSVVEAAKSFYQARIDLGKVSGEII